MGTSLFISTFFINWAFRRYLTTSLFISIYSYRPTSLFIIINWSYRATFSTFSIAYRSTFIIWSYRATFIIWSFRVSFIIWSSLLSMTLLSTMVFTKWYLAFSNIGVIPSKV